MHMDTDNTKCLVSGTYWFLFVLSRSRVCFLTATEVDLIGRNAIICIGYPSNNDIAFLISKNSNLHIVAEKYGLYISAGYTRKPEIPTVAMTG